LHNQGRFKNTDEKVFGPTNTIRFQEKGGVGGKKRGGLKVNYAATLWAMGGCEPTTQRFFPGSEGWKKRNE